MTALDEFVPVKGSSMEHGKKQILEQSIKFVLFSASAGIIQIISFTILNEVADLPYWPGYLVALVLSVL